MERFNECRYHHYDEIWDGKNEFAYRICEKGHNDNLPHECEKCKDFRKE